MAAGHASGDAVVGVTVAFTILAFMATATRLFTRTSIVHNAGWDDISITIACILTVALTAAMCMQVQYGMGRHTNTLTDVEKKYSLIWFWASVWVYYIALCFAKLSILLQYLRMFPDRKFRLSCFTLMGVIVGWTLWAFFSAVFACWPIRYFWDTSIEGTCLNRLAVWFSNAAMNICTDICTAVLPLPVFKSWNLPKRQRYILMIVFGMGGVVCIISILRLSALYAISVSDDVSWDNPLAAIWSSTEVNVGILCSCLPTLRGCVSRYFPKLFVSVGSRNSRTLPLELSGPNRTRPSCHISANTSQGPDDKQSGRLMRMAHRFHGGEKELEEGSSVNSSSAGRTSPPVTVSGIHVTTIVEQEEEREGEMGIRERDSTTNLVPTQLYDRA